jgi:hypothetical protein
VEFARLSAFWTSEDPVELYDFVPQNWWVRRIENDDDVHHPKTNCHGLIHIGIPCHATHVIEIGCFCIQPTLILIHLLLLDEECFADLASLVNCIVGSWRGQMMQYEVSFDPFWMYNTQSVLPLACSQCRR